jgi:hypothetical protein
MCVSSRRRISAFERRHQVIGERRVEVARHAQPSFQDAELPLAVHLSDRDEARDRLAGLRDHDFLAPGDVVDQARKVRFCRMDV